MKKIFVFLFLSFTSMAQQTESYFHRETAEVKKWLASGVLADVKNYCTKGQLSCRSMYKIKDKTTGKLLPFFFDTFVSTDRQVGSTCYVVPTKDSNIFNVYSDMILDGQVNVTWKSSLKASVSYDPSTNTYLFQNMKLPRLGTTFYLLGTLSQTDIKVVIDGIEYDEKNPNHKVPVKVEYFRVNF